MTNAFLRKKLLFNVLVAALGGASAATPVTDADLFMCNVPTHYASFRLYPDRLQTRWLKESDGDYVIAGPIQRNNICLQKIRFGFAFGVLAVMAEVCGGSPEPILDFMRSQRRTLQESAQPNPPGVISSFGVEDDSVTVYYGEVVRFEIKPNPASSQISFACVKKLGGPQ